MVLGKQVETFSRMSPRQKKNFLFYKFSTNFVGMMIFKIQLGDVPILSRNLCTYGIKIVNLHFNSFDFYAPRISSFIQGCLHRVGNRFSFRQNFRQIFGAKNISESRSR